MDIQQSLSILQSLNNAKVKERIRRNKEHVARDKYIRDVGGVSRRIADLTAPMLPERAKPNKSAYGGEAPHLAIDKGFAKDDPMRGIGRQVSDAVATFEGKKLPGSMTGEQLVNTVFKEALKRRLGPAYRYKLKQDTSWFGKETGHVPGYDQFKANFEAEVAAGRDPKEILHGFTPKGLATNAGILVGMNAVAEAAGRVGTRLGIRGAAKLVGRGLFGIPAVGLPGIAAKVGGLALIGLADFGVTDAAMEAVSQSKWAKARTGDHLPNGEKENLKVMGAQLLAGGMAAAATHKAIKRLSLRKVVKEEAEKLVADKPTAENMLTLYNANNAYGRAKAQTGKAISTVIDLNANKKVNAYSVYDHKGNPLKPLDPNVPNPPSQGVNGVKLDANFQEIGEYTVTPLLGKNPAIALPAPIEKITAASSMNRAQRASLKMFYDHFTGAKQAVIALGHEAERLPADKLSAIHRYFATNPSSRKIPSTILGNDAAGKALTKKVNDRLIAIGPNRVATNWKTQAGQLDEAGLVEMQKLEAAGVDPEIGVVRAGFKSSLRKSRVNATAEAGRNKAVIQETRNELRSAAHNTNQMLTMPAKRGGLTSDNINEIAKRSGAEISTPILSKKGAKVHKRVKEAVPIEESFEEANKANVRLEMFRQIAKRRETVSPKTSALSRDAELDELINQQSLDRTDDLIEKSSLRAAQEEEYFRMLSEDPIAAADDRARNSIKKFGILIPVLGLTALGVSGADEAEAGVMSTLAEAGAKTTIGAVEHVMKVTGKEGNELAKEILKTNLVGEKGSVLGRVKKWMDGFSTTPRFEDIVQKSSGGGLTSMVVANLKNTIMTPAAVASAMYKEGANPMVELASRMTAMHNNIEMHKQAVKEILSMVPEYKSGFGDIRKATKSLVEKWEQKQAVAAYTTGTRDKLKETLKGMSRKQDPVGYDDMAKRVADMEKAADKAMAELKPFQGEWEATVKELAGKHSSARIALAIEDTAEFVEYPWLKHMLSADELAAVNAFKDLNIQTGQRIVDAGGDIIKTRPYAHHALHPDSNFKGIKEALMKHTPNMNDGIAMAKLHSRRIGSKMMIPDVEYMYARYIPDVERRMQVMKFWKKNQAGGWDAHVKRLKKYGLLTEELDAFWKHTKKTFAIDPPSKGQEWARRYYSLEVAWRLFLSGSVGFKHLMKQTANLAMFPVDTWAKGASRAPKALFENKMRGLQTKWPSIFGEVQGKPSDRAALIKAYTHQGNYNTAIAEMDIFDTPTAIFDKWIQQFNEKGSAIVAGVEAFDRGATVLMGLEMAAKKGMTPVQATYAMYDSILKANFLSGIQNPSWIRNPYARAFFMFQGTPYKLFEQRALQAVKAGKDLKKAVGVTMDEWENFRSTLKRGEAEFKWGLIYDALTSTKDIYGQSVTKQFIKNVATMGGLIWMGDKFFDSDIHDQVFHLPFFKMGGSSPGLMLNPIISAGYKATMKRHESDTDWMMLDFANKWIGSSGPAPAVVTKLMRTAEGDIPEVYQQAPWRYMLGIPKIKE